MARSRGGGSAHSLVKLPVWSRSTPGSRRDERGAPAMGAERTKEVVRVAVGVAHTAMCCLHVEDQLARCAQGRG